MVVDRWFSLILFLSFLLVFAPQISTMIDHLIRFFTNLF